MQICLGRNICKMCVNGSPYICEFGTFRCVFTFHGIFRWFDFPREIADMEGYFCEYFEKVGKSLRCKRCPFVKIGSLLGVTDNAQIAGSNIPHDLTRSKLTHCNVIIDQLSYINFGKYYIFRLNQFGDMIVLLQIIHFTKLGKWNTQRLDR